jgi:ABC-type branched-subunit amino acid transport system permease subunit
MLSAGLTSVAGALYAMMFGFVDPESGLGILISVKMLIMAALGGAGLLFGPLVGALILVPLEEISNSLLGGNRGRRHFFPNAGLGTGSQAKNGKDWPHRTTKETH